MTNRVAMNDPNYDPFPFRKGGGDHSLVHFLLMGNGPT